MSGSMRVAFGFEDGEAVDVGPGRLRLKGRRMIMNDAGGEPAGPMLNPPHLGELIRERMDEVGWNVTETASRLGCERGTLSRLLTSLVALLLCAPGALRGQTACPTPWQLEEVLRIGSLESTDLVSSVLDLAIGPDSALYVAQAMVPAVTVFSLDGQVLRRIGRAGQGPGEMQLAAVAVGWIGDTLWVADFNRIQLFTPDPAIVGAGLARGGWPRPGTG